MQVSSERAITLRPSAAGLPGDSIEFREGFDGKEPDQLCRYWRALAGLW